MGEQVVDEYETPFGIREALFDADQGFLLNGEHVKLNGVCLHHDGGSVGAAVPERVWERRFEVLRQMGCNAIRTSHNPPAPEFLDLCDRMGFLVMNEAFDEWKFSKPQVHGNGYSLNYDEWHERDVTDFVRRDRNHPSVVLWSCGNEIGDQLTPRGVELLRDLLNIFHREDPTRFVTAACDDIVAEPRGTPVEFLSLLDVVGYNYVDRWRERKELYYSVDKAAHPNWRMIGTESSGMGGARGDYRAWFLRLRGRPPPWRLRRRQPPGAARRGPGRGGAAGRRDALAGAALARRGFRGLDTEQLWKFVRTHDYVAGDFMWTGIDYLGESGWPSRGATSGCIDSCGFPEGRLLLLPEPVDRQAHAPPLPALELEGPRGPVPHRGLLHQLRQRGTVPQRKIGGRQRLRLSAIRHGGRYGQYAPGTRGGVRTTSDLHLAWDVPYEPGTLKAVGTKAGKTAVEVEISTTGDPAAIELSVDRDTIRADRRDVAHVTVKVVDAQGRLHPDADNEVTFEIQGEGKLIGVDDGNMADLGVDFKGKVRKASHGMCLAMVQSTANAGQIRVTATSPGLKPATVTISTKA